MELRRWGVRRSGTSARAPRPRFGPDAEVPRAARTRRRTRPRATLDLPRSCTYRPADDVAGMRRLTPALSTRSRRILDQRPAGPGHVNLSIEHAGIMGGCRGRGEVDLARLGQAANLPRVWLGGVPAARIRRRPLRPRRGMKAGWR